MPGIFGFILRHPNSEARRIADRLSRDLSLFDHQTGEVVETGSEHVMLGRSWIEGGESDGGSSSHATPDVACVVDGYIVRTREDCGAATALAAGEYAQAAILAYERFGVDFGSRLEGPFSLVLHDRRTGQLLGVTDRHGLSPLYRYDGPEGAFFCSLLGPMARSGLFPARVDPAAAATSLGHQHMFYRQSLLEDVVAQGPASVAVTTADESACTIRRFWNYGQDGPRGEAPFRQRLDELCDALLSAIDRIVALPGRLFTSLSGGLDSRLVAGLALSRGAKMEAWTFGGPGAPDLEIAGEICRRHGMPHNTYGAEPADLLANLEAYASVINGSGPMHFAFALERCRDLLGRTDRVLNGYRGGLLLGSYTSDRGVHHRLRWWKGRLGLGPTVVSPDLGDIRTDEDVIAFYGAIRHHAAPRLRQWAPAPVPSVDAMMRDAFDGPLADTPMDYRLEQWMEEYGGGRHGTLVSILPDRHFYGDASLFYDYDVRDRCVALDPRDRRGNRAYVEVLKRLLPDLAELTYANTGFPASMSGTQLVANRALRRLKERVTGRRRVRSTNVDSREWLREPAIAEYCGDLVNSASFLSRPWWNGAVVAADFDGYLAGTCSMQNEFWAAVTLELFARRWLDRPDSL